MKVWGVELELVDVHVLEHRRRTGSPRSSTQWEPRRRAVR
jgi:hypothetical protein